MLKYTSEKQEEYNIMQNLAFQINNKYSNYIGSVTYYYENKKITEQEYIELINTPINKIPQTDNPEIKKLALNKDEVNFIEDYCELSAKNEIIGIKRNYSQKIDNLIQLENSILLGQNIDALSIKEKRQKAKEIITAYYSERISQINDSLIDFQRSKKHQRFLHTELIAQDYIIQRERLKNELTSKLDELTMLDETSLTNVLYQWYEVNKEYYNWFISKHIEESNKRMSIIDQNINAIQSFQAITEELKNNYATFNQGINEYQNEEFGYFQLLEIVFNYDTTENDKKYKEFRSLSKTNNQSKSIFQKIIEKVKKRKQQTYINNSMYDTELNKIFQDIINKSEYFKEYLTTTFGQLPSSNLFDQYLKKIYNYDTRKVSPRIFLSDIIEIITDYYLTQSQNMKTKLNHQNKKIKKEISQIKSYGYLANINSQLMKKIANYNSKGSHHLDFLTAEEENIIYDEIVKLVFTKENQSQKRYY